MRVADSGSFSRAAIEAHQFDKLKALLAVLADNPFYSAKLKNAHVVDAEITSLADFSAKIPFTFKSEIAGDQAQHPPYGTNLTYPLARYTRFTQTSGTTGRPVRWLDTQESWDWMVECWTRVYQTAHTGPEDRVFFPFSFGPFLGFWVAFEAAARMGSLTISGGAMRSPARLQAILENEVTVLCSTPSYALHLGEVARQEKLDLSAGKVKKIIVAGEPGGSISSTRALIEKVWPGAHVIDHHGMTEIGPVSYECPELPGTLHIIEAAFFAEILSPDTGSVVEPGEVGELVLTNLGRLGSPLLRYRTGDVVRRARTTPCLCGSSELALEGGILARGDSMLIVRGVNVYPSAVEEVLRSCGIAEFRVETHTERSLTEMKIQIEPQIDNDDTNNLTDQVAAALHRAMGLRVLISCVPHGTLPRFEGKAKRWFTNNSSD